MFIDKMHTSMNIEMIVYDRAFKFNSMSHDLYLINEKEMKRYYTTRS